MVNVLSWFVAYALLVAIMNTVHPLIGSAVMTLILFTTYWLGRKGVFSGKREA